MTEPVAVTAESDRDVTVEIDSAIARGLYSNLVLVNRSRTELTIDFAYMQPDDRAVVQARIILAPSNARELVELLTRQLEVEDAELRPPRR
jgi:hypothetical protein